MRRARTGSQVRAAGRLAAALTNNWRGPGDGISILKPHFDVFMESAVRGWQGDNASRAKDTLEAFLAEREP
jgi:hypothetical protein